MAPSAKLIIFVNTRKDELTEQQCIDLKNIALEIKEIEDKLDSIKRELCR